MVLVKNLPVNAGGVSMQEAWCPSLGWEYLLE